jgi:hypothetical protein
MATDAAPSQLPPDWETEQWKSKFKRVNGFLLLMVIVPLPATSLCYDRDQVPLAKPRGAPVI